MDHLTILNLNNFKIIEAMGMKIIAWRSPWRSTPNFMKIYQAVQKLLVGDTETDRQVI
jgi:hypothetical protein